ncbi:hypothetical protein B0A52_09676 [Exophiala mesophila]|uniref:Large ribosomal subunit protein bL27m n=1 Tax=Exophiala mesophila TaxID=212818 RepID=A0A438MS01_EXOME|nr:hypothetical protein B0A52_09676 [Exophiala mesophila]
MNSLSFCSYHTPFKPQSSKILVRYASHAAQGRANGPTDSAGRRLGAKKSASEYVVPGNIIFKQRGTKWHPGENVGIGKDHSIYATESGYVRYYRDPARHPKRRYIGVALEKDGPGSQLPATPNAPTRRRLNMFATPMKEPQVFTVPVVSPPETTQPIKSHGMTKYKPRVIIPTFLREGTNREANSSIGREAERQNVKVDGFDRKNRWQAWRKRATRLEAAVASKAAKGTKKTKGKKSNKGVKIGGKKR